MAVSAIPKSLVGNCYQEATVSFFTQFGFLKMDKRNTNAGENDDWIQKNTQFQQKFWEKNLVRLRSKQKFSKTIASNYIKSYMVGKLGFPAFS